MPKNAASQKIRQTKKSRSQWLKEEEFSLYGWNACLRVFEKRPEDVRRVFFSRERSSQLAAVKQWCRAHKLPYRELDAESLNKVAGSVHHEGVVMVVRPIQLAPVHSLIRKGLAPEGIWVALDRVVNPHNVGAILRSCAYFGVNGLMVGPEEGVGVVTPSAARTAEGAWETVPVYRCSDLPSALRDFRKANGFVLGADLQAARSLHEVEVPLPCTVVLGNEREGLSARVKRRCDEIVYVPGAGDMQSLNVAVAAGVILAEIHRRQPRAGTSHTPSPG